MQEQIGPAWIYDLSRQGDWWVFRWHSESFWETLNRLKSTVPPSDRSWNEEMQQWSVRCGDYDDALAAVFRNWRSKIEAVKAQLPLPMF